MLYKFSIQPNPNLCGSTLSYLFFGFAILLCSDVLFPTALPLTSWIWINCMSWKDCCEAIGLLYVKVAVFTAVSGWKLHERLWMQPVEVVATSFVTSLVSATTFRPFDSLSQGEVHSIRSRFLHKKSIHTPRWEHKLQAVYEDMECPQAIRWPEQFRSFSLYQNYHKSWRK